MKKYFRILILISLSTLLFSCRKDNMDPEPAIPHQKIGEGFAAGAASKVEVYANNTLFTGYNTLYVALYDSVSNQRIDNAVITLAPMMDMGTMQHSCPVENPATTATDHLFQGAAVFIMPSGSMGAWTLNINVAVNGKQGTLSLPLNITEPTPGRLKSFVSLADNSKFFVALIAPGSPKVGVNDMELAIYKAENMMMYPADSSLTLTLTPEMPTMGHGSPNNVNPVHRGKGHYQGKVNFTMTGLWYLNLDFQAGAAVADSITHFEVNF